MKRVNGGVRIGRTWLGFRRWLPNRYSPKRITWRSGGQATPGSWWMLTVPGVGELTINRDRTLFGWDDPANGDTGSRASDLP
jgi:hypothetical protein